MTNIVSFQAARAKRSDSEAGDINQLLKRATLILKEESGGGVKDKFGVVGRGKLKKIFEKKITEEILRAKLISGDTLLCGIYVSVLLDEFVTKRTPSWWAIDYAVSEDPEVLKQGGDTCFIICGVFPARGNVRSMDISYYQKVGAGLYNRFYNRTNKEIGYHMSQQFETMAHVVQTCLKNF
ncbi:MAG: hypothetical protein WCV59_05655 [Parcubacteria group bacterium]